MASHPIRVLSLCSGYGGLDLATRLVFPSARTLCYVEREISCARVLAARMADGSIDPAPVWDDISNFDPSPWAGAVDLIVAGFPCQPHSVAGKREGVQDHRWPVWDDVIRIARACAARSVFLENVPGLLTSSGGASIARVRADLDSAGFAHQSACIIAASDVGASHQRKRLFILAHSDSHTIREQSGRGRWSRWQDAAVAGADGKELAHAHGQRQSQRGWNEQNIGGWPGNKRASMGNPNSEGLEGYRCQCKLSAAGGQSTTSRAGYGVFAPGPGADWSTVDPHLWPATAQPTLRRVADGASRWMDITRSDRLRMLGNGVVPLQAAIALQALMESLEEV